MIGGGMKMLKTFEVNLDIEIQTSNSSFTVSQNDLKTIEIIITLTQDKQFFDLTGLSPRIAVKKPSGKTVIQDCTVEDPAKGKFSVILDSQAYTEVGVHTAEVYIYNADDTQVAVTGTFTYTSRIGIFSDLTIESTNDWQAINNALLNYMTNDQAKALIDSVIATNGGINLQDYYTKAEIDPQFSSVDEQLGELSLQLSNSGSPINNHTFTYVYNADGSIASETEKDSNNVVIKSVIYTYDSNGKLTQSATTTNGQTMTSQYSYDSNGNITSIVNTATVTTSSAVGAATIGYAIVQ